MLALAVVIAGALAAAGCATRAGNTPAAAPAPQPGTVLRAATIDRALEQRILALDPERISEDDVAIRSPSARRPRSSSCTAASIPSTSR